MQVMYRLYTTGVFFFAVAYIGRDLLPVAQLLHATHAEQVFQGVQDPALRASLPVGERSILGNLLPESLLYQLEAYGPKAFAEQMTRCAPPSTPPRRAEFDCSHRMHGTRSLWCRQGRIMGPHRCL